MSQTVTIQIRVPADRQNYVESSARMRNISETQMLRRVIDFVLKDQMILSILDDEDRPSIKTAPVRNTRGMGLSARSPVIASERPSTPVLEARRSTNAHVPRPAMVSIPQRPNSGTISWRKPQPKTKEELRRELEQIVRNTASLPVE